MSTQSRTKGQTEFVMLSGGPDSTTLLNEVIRSNLLKEVETRALFINFGQPYLYNELVAARSVAASLKVQLDEINVAGLSHAFMGVGEFGYIILRNVVEATYGIALAYARRHEATGLYHANIKEDVDDLPWLPRFFVRLSELGVSIGEGEQVIVHSPYLTVPKSEVFERASEMGVNLESTWSCLRAGLKHCGECRACKRRQMAFTSANISDTTSYLK